jgi:protocatechuate 3,4-dioxygenase beta subunit
MRMRNFLAQTAVFAALSANLVVQGAPAVQNPQAVRRDSAALPASTGSGRIRGRVVAAGTNAPIHRVQLVLQWSGNSEFRRVTQTDAQGRYEFTELPVGRFTLSAGSPGYVGLQYGQRRPYESGTPIPLREGETAASIDFALPRGSVITGRVTDEFGQPLVQAQVQARRFRYTDRGQRSLFPVGPIEATDDRGEFRLFGLMPGEYLVGATVRPIASLIGASTNPNSPIDGFQPTYFPGTPNAAEAQPISLGIAQEVTIQLALTPARLVTVSGMVRDSQDRPVFPAQVTLWTRTADLSTPFSVAPGGNTAVSTAADGTFAFAATLPGEYSLEVRNRVPGGIGPFPPAEAGFLAITVRNVDVSGLRITTSRGATVSGKVVWEGSAPRTGAGGAPIQLRASAQTADSLFPGTIMLSGNIDETGDFQIGGVYNRVYVGLPLSANANWTVKSVTLGDQQITDTPIDASLGSVEGVRITMTDKLSHVAGHVTDDSGKPVTQYVVVLQPAEQKDPRITARFIRTARPDTEGRFELRTVRPGRTSRRRSRRLKKAASSRRSSRRSCVAAHASSG